MASYIKRIGVAVATVGSATGIIKLAVDASNNTSPIHASSIVLKAREQEPVATEFQIEREPVAVEEKVALIELERVNEDEKQRLKSEADRAFQKMDDYSFRLFSSCGKGTGWILDYELPKEPNKYPTTWYIATNAHVVVGYGFSQNPYKQELPNSDSWIRYLRSRYKLDYSGMSLAKNAGSCQFTEDYGYFDWNMSKADSGERLKSDQGAVQMGQIYESRLFYVPINFLEENQALGVAKENYKDFAVLEIEFKDEKHARDATRDFADKYKVEYTDAINVFADPLEKRGWDKIQNSTENFYSLAYPHIEGDKFKSTKSWNADTLEGDKLSEDRWDWYHNRGDQEKVKGYIPYFRAGKPIKWNKKEYSKIGHFYLLKNHPMAKGSSGSMHIDGAGNLLGLRSVGESGRGAIHTMVDPIRSEGFTKGEIKTPKYDLILGGIKGQKSSYKDQVLTHNKNTWLNARQWKHITEKNIAELKEKNKNLNYLR